MNNEDISRGGADPDFWGYPYEHEPTCYLNVHGGHGSKCDCKYSEEIDDENQKTMG